MKVLNWVTQRFQNVHSCIAVMPVSERDYMNTKHIEETQALLKHADHLVMDNDMLIDWKDGILAIGTIAISPLEASPFDFIAEDFDNTNDLNDNAYDNLEENPLINVTLYSHELEKEVSKDGVIALQDKVVIAKEEGQTIKKRITLADLLFEDSDHKLVKHLGDDKLNYQDDYGKDMIVDGLEKPCVKMIKPNSRTKQGLCKAKKFLKEDLRPIKKINQLMKRMMKKKIHPDTGGKIQPSIETHDIVINLTKEDTSHLLS